MHFNNPVSTKNEKQKYDSSTLKKINQPFAFAARFPSRSARTDIICAFVDSSSG
jgi:hypothetical protein